MVQFVVIYLRAFWGDQLDQTFVVGGDHNWFLGLGSSSSFGEPGHKEGLESNADGTTSTRELIAHWHSYYCMQILIC